MFNNRYSFGKIISSKNIEEAKKLIGKWVVADDHLSHIDAFPLSCTPGILSGIRRQNCAYPFEVEDENGKYTDSYVLIRELIEEPRRKGKE